MKLSKLFMTALLVGTLAVVGCGDDGGDSSGGGNTNGGGGEVCTLGFCGTNDVAQAACQDAYDDCLLGDKTPAECQTIAETANCEESNL